jgi:hypothetical protein
MARIINNPDLRILEMADKCGHCAIEIKAFVLALINSNSLVEPGLESAGFIKFSMTESKSLFGFARRQYRYDVCNCGGYIVFYWKKANVKLIEFNCPPSEEAA